jgi:hypothetical protein
VESKFKKILLQSTVFTCLSSGVTVTMADVLPLDRETTVGDGYITHHNANFVDLADDNPVMKAIKEQQQEHRATIRADVALMLGAVEDSTVSRHLDKLKDMIAAALTADADAINDIEDRHVAKSTTDTVATLKDKANLYKGAITKTDTMFGVESDIKPGFIPDQEISRAEAAVMIARMHGYKDSDASSYTSSSFTDLSTTSWAVGQINYLKSKGIVNGTSPTAFNPTGIVTKAAMAVMIAKAHGYTADYTSTTDVGTSPDWATPYIQYAVDKGFMDTSTDYNDNMTRADVTTMIAKADGYTAAYVPNSNLFSDVTANDAAAAYISYLADKGVIRVKRSDLTATIQHYRLAYFLMLKLSPWLGKEYKNDTSEADEVLKDEIPTHYPEWTDKKILIKGLKVKLDNEAYIDTEEKKISFSKAKISIPAGTKIYSYDGINATEVASDKYTIALSTDGLGATISGLTKYGVYYVEIDGEKHYFTVESTQSDEFVYAPGKIIGMTTTINEGLKTAAEENSKFRPKLSLERNRIALDRSTFKVRLKGDTTWKSLSDLETNDFLKSTHNLEFSGLNGGSYTFIAAASDEVVITPLADGSEPETLAETTAATTGSDSFMILKSIVKFNAVAADKVYDGNTDATITSWSATTNTTPAKSFSSSDTTGFSTAVVLNGKFKTGNVGTNKDVDGTVKFRLYSSNEEYRNNYINLPTFTTNANITAAPVTPPPVTPPPGGGTTSSIEFVEIIQNMGSPYLKATGTVQNIPAGSYNVSINSDNNDEVEGTIVVDANGNFYGSLAGLTFNADEGESVTATITDAGDYIGLTFTFTTPVIEAEYTPADVDNFEDYSDGRGTVTFTVDSNVLNGITPTVTPKAGNAVTAYASTTAVASGVFTRGYSTTDAVGSFIPRGSIDMLGTKFIFTAAALTSTIDDGTDFALAYMAGTSTLTINNSGSPFSDGEPVSNILVHDTVTDLDILIDSTTATITGNAFDITLSNGKTLVNDSEISFAVGSKKYSLIYSAG